MKYGAYICPIEPVMFGQPRGILVISVVNDLDLIQQVVDNVREPHELRGAVTKLSDQLGTPIEVIVLQEYQPQPQRKYRKHRKVRLPIERQGEKYMSQNWSVTHEDSHIKNASYDSDTNLLEVIFAGALTKKYIYDVSRFDTGQLKYMERALTTGIYQYDFSIGKAFRSLIKDNPFVPQPEIVHVS